MDDTITSEQEKEVQTSPREVQRKSSSPQEDEEYPSVQHEVIQPSHEPYSSSSYREDSHLQQSVNRAQDESSPRVSFTGQDQNSERGTSVRPHEHHPRASSSPPPPPPEVESSIYQLNDATTSFQDYSQSRAYGHRDVPSHRLMSGPPRDHNFALGQLTAAARYDMTTDSPDYYSTIEGRRRFYLDEDMGGFPKKRKVKGKGKQAERWEAMFERLVRFQQQHGHCLVPNRYPEDPSLGAWVSTQRRHYKILVEGRTDVTTPMNEERASRLESIGFAWATSDPRRVAWETRFQQLLEYKEKYGDCVVPIGWEENPRLSNWVSAQRQEYKHFRQGKKSHITPERIMLLNSVGFVWEAQRGHSKKKRTTSLEERDFKLGPSRAEQGLAATDGNTTTVANNMMARQAFDGIIPPPNTLRRPDIPPAPAPALLSHVLSLLATAQQPQSINAPHPTTAQRGALEAARMMENVVALQNRNPTLMRAPATSAPFALQSGGRLPGAAAYDSLMQQDMTPSVTSPTHASSSQLERLAFAEARQLQERRELLAATNALNQEQIITKHLLQALQQQGGMDSIMENPAAAGQVRGYMDAPRDDTAWPFSTVNKDAPQRAQHQITQPSLSLPSQHPLQHHHHPPAGIPGRSESETFNDGRFGAALPTGKTDAPSVSDRTLLSTASASPMKSVGTDLSPPSWEDRKLPARPDLGRSSGLPTRNNASIPGSDASSVPRSPSNNEGTLSVAKSSLSGDGSQSNDEEGVFSDAEEDETAGAFLMAARGSTRRNE